MAGPGDGGEIAVVFVAIVPVGERQRQGAFVSTAVVDFRPVVFDAGCCAGCATLATQQVGREIVGCQGQRGRDAPYRHANAGGVGSAEDIKTEVVAERIHGR